MGDSAARLAGLARGFAQHPDTIFAARHPGSTYSSPVTFFGATLISAVATVVLAILAAATAWYARNAFLKQSEEVKAIKQQVEDGREVVKTQGRLLKVQSDQLELQSQQLDDQRKATAAQGVVLGLQAADLQRAIAQRDLETEDRRRSQAAAVTAWIGTLEDPELFGTMLTAVVSNQSGQPIYDVQAYLYYTEDYKLGSDWVATTGGATNVTRVVMPHTDWPITFSQHARPYPDEDSDGITFRPAIKFTDAYGNRWERAPRGILNPVPADMAYPPNP